MNIPYIKLYEKEYEKVFEDISSSGMNQSPILLNWDFCPMKYPSAMCTVIKKILDKFSLNQVAQLIFSLQKGKDGSLPCIPFALSVFPGFIHLSPIYWPCSPLS